MNNAEFKFNERTPYVQNPIEGEGAKPRIAEPLDQLGVRSHVGRRQRLQSRMRRVGKILVGGVARTAAELHLMI